MAFLVAEIIRKKRDGLELSRDEIAFLVEGFASGAIPDYQVAAWLMATYLRGMDPAETVLLTRAMKESGSALEWRSLSTNFRNAHFADKHSTGGVGDKVSLILAPVAVCLDLKVPMMSGRGLGHTGGTVDKLESIPGFSMQPSQKTMIDCLDQVGACMMSQSSELCPADRKLYSLRDVTGTIESVPLITASIVSKKWAEGVDAIVYDVKCGSAAFMPDIASARELSRSLVRVSKLAGLKALAVVTRMEEPLGAYIGNALEVEESLQILSNKYPSPNHARLAQGLARLSTDLAAEMAVLAGTRRDLEAARREAWETLESGAALKVFNAMARLQGAQEGWQGKLPKAPVKVVYASPREGRIAGIPSRTLGLAGIKIGVGRRQTADKIDPATGFEMHVLPGDSVTKGQPLITLHLRDKSHVDFIKDDLQNSFVFGDPDSRLSHPANLVLERVEG